MNSKMANSILDWYCRFFSGLPVVRTNHSFANGPIFLLIFSRVPLLMINYRANEPDASPIFVRFLSSLTQRSGFLCGEVMKPMARVGGRLTACSNSPCVNHS